MQFLQLAFASFLIVTNAHHSSSSSSSTSSTSTDSSSSSTSSSLSSVSSDANDILYVSKKVPFVLVATATPFKHFPEVCERNKLKPALITKCNYWQAVQALSHANAHRAWAWWDTHTIQKALPKSGWCHEDKKCKREALKFPTSLAWDEKGSRMERWAWYGLKHEFFALCMKKPKHWCLRENKSVEYSSSSSDSESHTDKKNHTSSECKKYITSNDKKHSKDKYKKCTDEYKKYIEKYTDDKKYFDYMKYTDDKKHSINDKYSMKKSHSHHKSKYTTSSGSSDDSSSSSSEYYKNSPKLKEKKHSKEMSEKHYKPRWIKYDKLSKAPIQKKHHHSKKY